MKKEKTSAPLTGRLSAAARGKAAAVRRVKGSALISQDNTVVFTPYSSSPENSPWRILKASDRALLKCTDEVVQMRITVPRSTVADMARQFSNQYGQMLAGLYNDEFK